MGLLMVSTILACSDHAFPPSSALGFRLKTLEKANGSTTLTYDQNNRVASYTNSFGEKGLFFYDDQGRYTEFKRLADAQNPTIGTRMLFTYSNGTNDFTFNRYSFQSSSENRIANGTYKVDSNKRVTGFEEFAPALNGQDYEYTGDNITTIKFVVGRSLTTRTYEFDDKPNPFYGLILPGFDEYLRYNRNNVTKVTGVDQTGGKQILEEYIYEYNDKGLPTKVTKKDGTGEIRLSYESF